MSTALAKAGLKHSDRVQRRIPDSVAFAWVFCVVNLHLLRNLQETAYYTVYGLTTLYVTGAFINALRRRPDLRLTPFWLWVACALLTFLVSLQIISVSGSVYGLVRFLFAAPVFLAWVAFTNTAEAIRRNIVTMVVFFALASLTLPLQFYTGPIGWFADASTRAGLDRYGSLIGSLPVIGVVVGSYLLLCQQSRPVVRWSLVIGIAVPALISLSKAAIVNVVLALCLMAFFSRRPVRSIAFIGLCLVVVWWIFSLDAELSERLRGSLQSFGFSSGGVGGVSDDATVRASAWDRLTVLPAANLAALATLASVFVYFVGGGFGMGSTALVPEQDVIAPMAHNQYVELFTVMGAALAPFALYVVLLPVVRMARAWRTGRDPALASALLSYVLLLINGMFANGILYQPAGASIFYMGLFLACVPLAGGTNGPFGSASVRRIDSRHSPAHPSRT